MQCPKCQARMSVYASRDITDGIRERYRNCPNCGHKIRTQSDEEITGAVKARAPKSSQYQPIPLFPRDEQHSRRSA